MHKRNHFNAGRHPWPPIHQRTAGGANWHQQDERYRAYVESRREILDRMDGAGCIGWGVAAAIVALLVAVLGAVVWG